MIFLVPQTSRSIQEREASSNPLVFILISRFISSNATEPKALEIQQKIDPRLIKDGRERPKPITPRTHREA